jgi:hypothetical protein
LSERVDWPAVEVCNDIGGGIDQVLVEQHAHSERSRGAIDPGVVSDLFVGSLLKRLAQLIESRLEFVYPQPFCVVSGLMMM